MANGPVYKRKIGMKGMRDCYTQTLLLSHGSQSIKCDSVHAIKFKIPTFVSESQPILVLVLMIFKKGPYLTFK